MAILNYNSVCYRLEFTDGSILTLKNSAFTGLPAGEYTAAFPNFVRTNGSVVQSQGYVETTKHDADGNEWVFHAGGGITINNLPVPRNFSDYAFMSLEYNPTTKVLSCRTQKPLYFVYDTGGVNPIPWAGAYYRGKCGSRDLGEDLAKATAAFRGGSLPNGYGFSNIVAPLNNYANNVTGFYGYNSDGIIPSMPFTLSHVDDYAIDLNDILDDFDEVIVGEEEDDDPYNDPDAGGGGDFDDGSSDDIDIPSLPTISAADTGFVTLFNPNAGQLKNLANYLWSNLFDLDTFKKLFADPMSAILGLSILPVAIPSSGSRAVSVGNISTGVTMPVASQQFLEIDCGSVTLKREKPGTYLDFSPYTRVDLYLPFIGTHPLDVDEVMGKTITVKYHVDILSGACTAFVKVGSSVLYQFIGSCAISIPINGNDWTNAINGVMNIAGSIGSMVLTGGATAPMAAGSIASTVTNNLKPSVEKSGSVSGAGGLMGVKRPYLIISRPNRNVAKNQNKYIGYPTFKTMKMRELSGYNSVMDVHLDNIPATQDEIDEIRTLLKQGVIF